MKYPNSNKEHLVEDMFGIKVEDSYRWMEDESNDNLNKWVDEQNELTQSHLSNIADKSEIKERLESLFNYSKYENVRVIGKNIVFQYNDGLKNQSVFYIQRGINETPVVLIDPNTLSEDGTVAISLNGNSKDNKYLSYLQSSAGSDWQEIKIINLDTLEEHKDKLEWVKFTFVSWQNDGFYYSAFDAPESGKVLSGKNSDMKVFYHRLGTAQSEDKEIYSDKENPLRYHTIYVTEDEKTLILSSRAGTYGGEISIMKDNSFEPVFKGFDSEQIYFGSVNEFAYFLSDENAKNKKIIKVNTLTLELETIVNETEVNLQSVYIVKEKLILNYLEDVKSVLKIYDLEGNYEKDFKLDSIGTPFNFTTSDEYEEIFYGFTSYIQPTGFYTFTLNDLKSKEFKTSKVAYDISDYVTEQVFSKSKDGTMIPSFVTYKKGLNLDSNNPTMLYAYGGFSISLQPYFNPSIIYFIERGGVHVEANIRGGSEYGEAWHKDGMLFNKQNVYDDFIAVAEDLINKKYTSKDKLAISGRSNGGLLMGVVANQRPDLFSVVFPGVGVMDMIRYHKFTIGWGWAVEYGNPDEKEHFENIIKYSPLHKIEGKNYPATMVFTADHDDRVVPAHSFKYIARLQEKNTSKNPMLIRIDKNSGHGAGISTEKKINEETDKFAFLFNHIK